MTKATPDGVVHGHGVVIKTENSANTAKAADETLLLDVFFADRPTAELTDRIGVFIALNAFHSWRELFYMLFEDFYNPVGGVAVAKNIRRAGHTGVRARISI